jgi:hypothetical protein
VLLAAWAAWAVRDLRVLPRYPARLAGPVALLVALGLAAWTLLVNPYLVGLTRLTNLLLTGLVGLPVLQASLSQHGIDRYLEVVFPEGPLRVEVAASTVTAVPYLALMLGASAGIGRRAAWILVGLAALFGLHLAGSAGLVWLGRAAPALVPLAETLLGFISLSAPPVLWLVAGGPGPEARASASPPGSSGRRPGP